MQRQKYFFSILHKVTKKIIQDFETSIHDKDQTNFFCQMHAEILESLVYIHMKCSRKISIFPFAVIFTVIAVGHFSHAWFFNEEFDFLSIVIRKLFWFFPLKLEEPQFKTMKNIVIKKL